MTLLVAQSAVFEFLSCAQTTRAIFSHAGVYFFCVEARLRRAIATATLCCC